MPYSKATLAKIKKQKADEAKRQRKLDAEARARMLREQRQRLAQIRRERKEEAKERQRHQLREKLESHTIKKKMFGSEVHAKKKHHGKRRFAGQAISIGKLFGH